MTPEEELTQRVDDIESAVEELKKKITALATQVNEPGLDADTAAAVWRLLLGTDINRT